MAKAKSSIPQDEHLDQAGTKKVTTGILVPGKVILQDTAVNPVLVGKGNICRIEVTSDTFVAFGSVDMPEVTQATSPGLKLKIGVHLVVALDEFLRTNSTVERLEVIEN